MNVCEMRVTYSRGWKLTLIQLLVVLFESFSFIRLHVSPEWETLFVRVNFAFVLFVWVIRRVICMIFVCLRMDSLYLLNSLFL